MENKTLTQRNAFTRLLGLSQVQEDKELVAFLEHRIQVLNDKNASSHKSMTKTQKANEVIKSQILNAMEVGTSYRAKDIQVLVGLDTNQKATALLKQLVDDGKIKRIEEKGIANFQRIKVD